MTKSIDIKGKIFGAWTVIDRSESNKHGGAMWNCVCKCGTKKALSSAMLRKGLSTKCIPCLKRTPRGFYSTPGNQVNKWTIIERDKSKNDSSICRCICGKISSVTVANLSTGGSKGCRDCYFADHQSVIGRVFYKWTALEVVKKLDKQGNVGYKCKCACGTIRNIKRNDLLSLRTSQCIKCHNKKT